MKLIQKDLQFNESFIPTGNKCLKDLFFLTKPAILGEVGTTLRFLLSINSKTLIMNSSSKDLSLIVSGMWILVKKIFLSCSAYSILANESETFTSNCLKNSLFSIVISLINKKVGQQR